MSSSDQFVGAAPSLESCWRSIILFGVNVASYKFALGRALLESKASPGDIVSLEQLAVPFSRAICEHLRLADKQGQFASSRFLDACRQANKGELGQDQLIDATVRLGFNNVIDAFHVVNGGEVPQRFFLDERKTAKGIRLTDSVGALREAFQFSNLPAEVEARWRLVETAWDLNLPRHALAVEFDPSDKFLVVTTAARGRTNITACRDALNGYQKGVCFYCNAPFELSGCEVDHFFPHVLQREGHAANLDGVWNLVLACVDCNRGPRGKWARLPEPDLLGRLHLRSEFLIGSHHPLRETLIIQTGASEPERRAFLQRRWNEAQAILIHTWRPELRAAPPT